uniref:Uncharacterized protein n=1 Tax=Mesocestoides corti TaxID=53468 RepID=A0A5K3G2C1_MESCO
MSQAAPPLGGNPFEDVAHEGLHDGHRRRSRLPQDASVGMHLTQHLVHVDDAALPPTRLLRTSSACKSMPCLECRLKP